MVDAATEFPRGLEPLLADVDSMVRGGRTPADAVAAIGKLAKLTNGQCQAIQAEYLRRNRRFIDYTDPRVLRDNPKIETWYSGPDQPGAWCWPPYKAMLQDPVRHFDPDDLARLDRASTKILASLPHPGSPAFNHRGLVVGYVQSGKTANYSALISKAADVGYRFFIVLSGITSSLRQQTQQRLAHDVTRHEVANWTWLTFPDADFGGHPTGPDGVIDPQSHRRRVIAVVKKNGRILDRLLKWIGGASPDTLSACPAIIIDDEADNASVNTKDPDIMPSTINARLRALLKSFVKVAYVGYTATPFANIFIDPSIDEDLFPRHFIFDLEKPKAYFGAEKIFGREVLWSETEDARVDGLDMIREVLVSAPDSAPPRVDEPALLVPSRAADRFDFEPVMPPSLEQAIHYFLLATATRWARGQQNEHCSMLVHSTMYVALHDKTRDVIEGAVSELRVHLEKRRSRLEALWDNEVSRVTEPFREPRAFDALWEKLPDVLGHVEVVVDNGRSESNLKYDSAQPRVVIAVGGNTFSRGLTLEGLVVSYFCRKAGAYDTLLQMGRWFGYRPGYEDLPRVWMTNELQEQFLFLAGIEEEIRRDIRRLEVEQKTPLDLAIRVRTHPKLAITARNKMGKARLVSASYSDRTVQSFLFNVHDKDWLRANLAAARTLISSARDIRPHPSRRGVYLAKGLGADQVVRFLGAYEFHQDHSELARNLLLRYIQNEQVAGGLKKWNLAVMGQAERQPNLGSLDIGVTINCINRSRYKTTSPANIKALMSWPDRLADIEEGGRAERDAEIVARRNQQWPDTGLLLLYPISRASLPERVRGGRPGLCPVCSLDHELPEDGSAVRHPLGAVEDVLGAALVFPRSRREESEYMANDLTDLFQTDGPEEGEVVPDDSGEVDR